MIRISIGIYGLPFLVDSGIRHLSKKNQWAMTDINSLDVLEAAQLDLIVTTVEDDLNPALKTYLSQHQTSVLLILSDHEAVDVKHLMSLGINAIVNWDCPEEEILTALRMAATGKKYICDRLLDQMLSPDSSDVHPAKSKLSEREMEVLVQFGSGLTTGSIAQMMHLSTHTVNSHRKNILKKLNLQHPSELIVYAWQTGLMKAH